MALLQQIDRKNQMFGQLSSFLQAMQSEPSTEQWKLKLEECDNAKVRVANLESLLENQVERTNSLEEEKVLLTECIQDMEGDSELLRSQMENEKLQAQKERMLEEAKRNELARKLNEAAQNFESLRKEMDTLQQRVQDGENRCSSFETRCIEKDKQLSAANAMVEKLTGIEKLTKDQASEIIDLRKVHYELTEKLAAARDSLSEANRFRQDHANANASLLTQLQIKSEKIKDITERCEKNDEIRKKLEMESQKLLDKTREDLMSAMADAIASKRVHKTVVEAKDIELATLKNKLEYYYVKESGFRVLQTTHAASENEKNALKSEIAVLRKEIDMSTKEVEKNEKSIMLLKNAEIDRAAFAKVVQEQEVQLQNAKNEVEVLAEKYADASSWKAKIQGHLVDLCQKMNVKDVSALTTVALHNKDMLQAAGTEIKELQRQLEDTIQCAESKEKEMQINVEQLSLEISTLTQLLQNAENRLTSQNAIIDDLRNKCTKVEEAKDESITDLANQINTAKKESSQKLLHISSQVTKQRERISQLENEKMELLQEAEELNQKIVRHSKAKVDAEMELSKTASELGRVREEVLAAEDRVSALQESMEQLNATLLGYQRAQATTVSKESMDEMEKELSAEKIRLEKDCRQLLLQVQELEAQLTIAAREKKNAETVALTKRSQLEDAIKAVATLKSEAEELKEAQRLEVKHLQDELISAKDFWT